MSVTAQEADLKAGDALMEKSVGLMQMQDWAGANEILDSIIDKYGPAENGVNVFGARFGSAYYNKGLCELKIAQQHNRSGFKLGDEMEKTKRLFEAAITSFEKCYAIKNTEKDSGNIYQTKSLLFIGNAQQGMDEFEKAIETYEKFQYEKNSIRDQFNLDDLSINIAICHWLKKEPDLDEAERFFLRSLRLIGNKVPSTFAMITGMRAMLNASEDAGQSERVEAFLNEHHGLIRVTLVDATQYLPRYSQMIVKAADMGLVNVSRLLASKIPAVDALLEIREKLAVMAQMPEMDVEIRGYEMNHAEAKVILDQQQSLEKSIAEAQEYALAAHAVGSERVGDFKGAVAGYGLLLERYPKTEHKADYLYNLSRVLVLLGDVEKAYGYGKTYLTEYSDHQYSDELKKVLMLGLYASQDYELCIELGDKVISELAEDSPVLDSCLHAMGASCFYDGRFTKSLPYIDRHYVMFPDSMYRKVCSYLHASVYGHVLQWDRSLILLDAFISTIDDGNVYMSHALYDKAYVMYSMEKYDESLAVLKQFIGKYGDSLTKAPAHILSGNIYLIKKQRDDAQAEYERAISTAKYTKNKYAEDEAYYLIITMLGQKLWEGRANEKMLDAVPYFNAYITAEPMVGRKSPFYTQIITNAMYALTQSDRRDEAFELLQKAIFEYNRVPNSAGTEGAMQSYLIALRNANVKDDAAIDNLKASPFITDSSYHQALVKVAEIDVLERSERRVPDVKRAALIDSLYKELHLEFKIEDLDNFTLIKVANYLEGNGGFGDKARLYYQGVIASDSKIKLAAAQVGLLSLLTKSQNPEDIEQAMSEIDTIIKDPFTATNAKAGAHYQLLELLNTQQKWERLTKETIAYLQYPSSVKKQVRRAEMLLATSYDKRDLTDKAIGSYTAVWVNSLFNLDQSALAMNRVVTLLWKRNNPAKIGVQDGKSDRQIAYESAYKYVRKTKKNFDETGQKISKKSEKNWRSIRDKVDTYGSDPGIKKFNGKP